MHDYGNGTCCRHAVGRAVGMLANGKTSPTVLSDYGDWVPMVVKVVDVAWESQEMSNASEGIARAELCDEPNARESRPLSASCPSTFNERVIISYVLSRQSDLEKQIEALYLTKSEMPYEQEELINAAVYRVDALEA
ncbi:unnamed protein product [Brassica rapa subsp. trilocularis]|uniref:Uncharacterized protein n=2 Tax=Brassica TaxID=3705 RepID=M4D6S6_BRACM